MTELLYINNFIEKNIYDNTIEKYFKKLIINDKNILKKYYKNLLIIIYYSFFENNTNLEVFKQKMSLNNYSDASAILLLLLPFINSNEDTNNIISFNDLVTKKYKNIDIKKDSPKYVYTNFQYNRCNRESITEIDYNEEYLKHNYQFLVKTISHTCNKLYVNWVDVIPYNMIDYRNEKLYKNTKEQFDNGTLRDFDFYDNNNLIKNLQKLTSLTIADIYETVTNEFYYQIKKVKWLIYDIKVENRNRPLPIILILNQIFGDTLSDSILLDWIKLPKNEQISMEEKWSSFINLAKTNNSFDNVGVISISAKNVKKILVSIIIFFNNHYKDIENLVDRKKYKLINFGIDDDTLDDKLDDNEEEIISNLKFSKILNVLKYIKTEYIYTFIKDSLDIMKLTWYSLILLKKNKNYINTIKHYEEKFQYNDKIKITKITMITMKNIYNFSKSFCHIKYKDKFTPLPRYWESLNFEQRKIIEDRLYDNTQNVLDWFNISRNLKSLHIKNVQDYTETLYNYIRSNLIDYVFESFISRGILSKLIPNNEISDKTKIASDFRSKLVPPELNKTIFKVDQSNKLWTDSYYFLTSTTYEHMDQVRYERKIDKVRITTTYFEYNGSLYSRAWYFAYALDWISQINFFNKFLNNRVIFVTGSTGVGKSTQVPKLLLYAQKAILYNSTSKIVCSQPRKQPTAQNAENVALEMGVPINDGNEILEKYYLQYKHQDNKHIKNTTHLSLKYITDGTVALEIKNPVLRKDIPKSPYFSTNLYDIVIIDEAHEHNTNMDIILSLMKYISLYNNTLKLVIVSATMDDDEPIYRRYYRDINDNKMFPLNYNIKNNNLDRINVDRRLHISPPGQTTRFKITDTYIEELPLNLRDTVSLAINLINKTKDGDMLIFQPGAGEIEKIITELNKPGQLPEHVIAVPYHSRLDKKHREIIENISKEKSSLGLLKTQNFNETENIQVGPNVGKYKRVVIVATNIAEASITIETLKYVIETGTQKTNIYDYSKRNTKMILKTISDSSRLQRRGRIGRVGPGDVYYLYEKGKTENIKTTYNICIQDIGYDLYRRLYSNSSEKILLSHNNDPNNPKNKLELMQLESIYGKFFKNFESYFNLDTYYDYYGNDSHYDYENYKNNTYYHENGYSSYNLNDFTGEFYVIHPEEIDLTRNIVGTITDTKAKGTVLKNNLLESTKINIFWETLRDNYFLDVIDKNIVKSELGIKFQELQQILEFEDSKLFKIFLYSYVFDVTEDIIRLISIVQLITKFSDTFLTSIKVNGKMMKSIGYATKLLGITSRGDLEGIMILLEYFHNYLDKIDLKYDNNLDSTKKTLITEISRDLASKTPDQFQKTFTAEKAKVNILSENFSYLTDDNYAELRKSHMIIKYLNEEFNSKQHEIDKICDKLFLNKETMKEYFNKYSQIKNTLFTYMNKNMDDTSIKSKDFELLEELTGILKKTIVNTNLDRYEKILTCFMMADSYNIVTNISRTNSYLYLYEPTIENIYQISTITQNTKNLDSFINNFYLSNLLYFYKVDIDKESMSMVNYIHPKLMENLYKIYNLNLLNDKIANLMKQIYIKVSTKNQVVSNQYFSELRELEDNLKENTKIYISKDTDIDKINIFNKKIREIMQ